MLNYDSTATDDDGSCIPFIYGCTNETMWNYNPDANTDDGSCIPFIYGCTYDTNLKYITPIIPHQREAPTVKEIPLNKFFFI